VKAAKLYWSKRWRRLVIQRFSGQTQSWCTKLRCKRYLGIVRVNLRRLLAPRTLFSECRCRNKSPTSIHCCSADRPHFCLNSIYIQYTRDLRCCKPLSFKTLTDALPVIVNVLRRIFRKRAHSLAPLIACLERNAYFNYVTSGTMSHQF